MNSLNFNNDKENNTEKKRGLDPVYMETNSDIF